MRRCLFVTKEYDPVPTSGGTLRTKALVDELARDHDVTVVHPGDGTEASTPDFLRALLRLRSLSGARTAGTRLLGAIPPATHGRYDLVVVDHTGLAALADELADRADRVLVSMHNVESRLMADRAARAGSGLRRVVMRREAVLLRRLEARVARRHAVLVCTPGDAAAMEAAGAGEVVVARNGIDARSPGPVEAGSRRPRSMVFSGALDWGPNVEGLAWFVERVWPLVRERMADASLTVAGRRPGRTVIGICAAPGVRLVADPPVMADVLATHRLGVVPLLTGGGSRIKILEYLAAGLDTVSTPVGAEGLEHVPPGLLERVPAEPALLAGVLLQRLGAPRDVAAGPAWVRRNGSWAVTLEPLRDWLGTSPAPARPEEVELPSCPAPAWSGPSPTKGSRA